jgi:2'-5' RNA ligase
MASSLDPEFAAAWARFRSLDALRLVPDTLESEWTRGRDRYLAFLIRLTDSEVRAYLREVVHAIEHIPGVEPYPEDYWHITIKGIGFETDSPDQPDDVATAGVARISETGRSIFDRQPAFEVTVGAPNAFPEVVFAEVRDSLLVRELNKQVFEALPHIVRYPFDGEVFLPHISIARFTSNSALAPLKDALAPLRAKSGPSLRVREIHLVRAHLSAAAPRLETIEVYQLPRGR